MWLGFARFLLQTTILKVHMLLALEFLESTERLCKISWFGGEGCPLVTNLDAVNFCVSKAIQFQVLKEIEIWGKWGTRGRFGANSVPGWLNTSRLLANDFPTLRDNCTATHQCFLTGNINYIKASDYLMLFTIFLDLLMSKLGLWVLVIWTAQLQLLYFINSLGNSPAVQW